MQPADGEELAEALRKDNALLRAEMGRLDARGNIPQHHGSEQSIMNVDVWWWMCCWIGYVDFYPPIFVSIHLSIRTIQSY